ncbi:MAG: hypothetical protein WDN30_13120 [Pararobbsia sp.]
MFDPVQARPEILFKEQVPRDARRQKVIADSGDDVAVVNLIRVEEQCDTVCRCAFFIDFPRKAARSGRAVDAVSVQGHQGLPEGDPACFVMEAIVKAQHRMARSEMKKRHPGWPIS